MGIKTILTLLQAAKIHPLARLALIFLKSMGVKIVFPCSKSVGFECVYGPHIGRTRNSESWKVLKSLRKKYETTDPLNIYRLKSMEKYYRDLFIEQKPEFLYYDYQKNGKPVTNKKK